MNTSTLLYKLNSYTKYRYNIIQVEIDSEPLEGVKIFRMTLESLNKIVRVSSSYNAYLNTYLMRVTFKDGETQITKEYKYDEGSILINVLDIHIPLYFKDLFPDNDKFKLSKEEYLELLPVLAF